MNKFAIINLFFYITLRTEILVFKFPRVANISVDNSIFLESIK